MKAEVVLTVSECKRLIAKGVASLDFIRARMVRGIIVLATGTTNAYVYEELMGETINKRNYVTGRTIPAQGTFTRDHLLPDLVLVDGRPVPDLNRTTALERMSEGDIFIKGANALNYAKGLAGITVGSNNSGTIGAAWGHIVGKRLRLLLPVGLEKEIPFDIQTLADLTAEPGERLGAVYPLYPVRGIVFTELEALKTLCDVAAYPVASGGVAGAEGGLRLLLVGESQVVQRALALVQSIQGEPPF